MQIIKEINKTLEEKKVMLEEIIEKNKKDLKNSIDNTKSNISKNGQEIIRINKKIEVIKYKMKSMDQKKSFIENNNNKLKDNEFKQLSDKRRLSYENLRASNSKNENEKINQNEDIKKRKGTISALKEKIKIKANNIEKNLVNYSKLLFIKYSPIFLNLLLFPIMPDTIKLSPIILSYLIFV